MDCTQAFCSGLVFLDLNAVAVCFRREQENKNATL